MPHTPHVSPLARKRVRESDEDLLAGFVSGFKEWDTSPKISSISSKKKASRPLSTRDVKDFDRFVVANSGPRRAKVSRCSNEGFDPLASPVFRQAPASSVNSSAHDAKRALKHLPVPHLAPYQPTSPITRHLALFQVPQRNSHIGFDNAKPLALNAAGHYDDKDLETQGLAPVPIQTRVSEPHMRNLPVPKNSRPPLPCTIDAKAELKPLVTPLTTRFAENMTKMGHQLVTHKGRDFKLPPAPPPLPISCSSPEPDPEITRGLGVSPKKKRQGNRTGRNKQGFILSNGLAERAANLFHSNDMKLSIWQTEASKCYTFASFTKQGDSSKRKPAPTSVVGPPRVRFRITSLCENVEPSGREVRGYVLARCEILSSRFCLSASPQGVGEPAPCNLNAGDMIFALFSLPSHKNGSGGASNVCSPSHVVEGAEVHVWEPWHEVPVNFKRHQNSDNAELGLRRVMLCTRFVAI